MNKLIKHEFRATARMILPFLAVIVCSALTFAVCSRMDGFPTTLSVILVMVISVAFMALGIMCLAIIIERFYLNVMKDNGYLTMTLPLSSHEFIWGELIMCLCWFLIVAAVLFATFICSMTAADMISLPESFGEIGRVISMFNEELTEHGVSGFMVAVIILEGIVGLLLGFFGFCLRIYSCMAVGQLFSKHRTLFSVIAYILIAIIVSLLFTVAAKIFVGTLSFDTETVGKAAGAIGLFDLVLLLIDAALYFPTAFLIGRRLNLA